MGRRFSGNGGGRAPRAATLASTVPAQAGALANIGRYSLLAPVGYAKTGGHANLAINAASGAVSATAALGAGTSQVLNGTVTGADGCVVPFALTLTGAAAAPGAPLTGMPAYYLNFTAANTARLKAMKQAVQSGTGRGRILGGMDSFMSGYGDTPTGTDAWANTESNAMMARVASFLNAKSTPVPAQADFAVPDHNATTAARIVEADPRLVLTNALPITGFPAIGGNPLRIGASGWVEFTPANAFDTVDMLIYMDTAAGSFAVSTDHGTTTLATISVQDTHRYVNRVSVSCPLGSTTVRLTRVTGTPFFSMLGTRTAAMPRIELVNAGASGRTLDSGVQSGINIVPGLQANTDWNWLASLPALFDGNAINACILQGGFNDWNTNGNDANAAAAALTTAIHNLQGYGVDVVYVTYGNVNDANWLGTAQTVLVNAAIAAGVPVVDARQLMGTWSAEYTAGHWFDSYHMRPYLQDLVAQAVANIFDYL